MKNLITFEEATTKAKKRNPKYNEAEEYSDAWYFYINDGTFRTGGDGMGLVVMKDGGAVKLPYEFFMNSDSTSVSTGKIYKI